MYEFVGKKGAVYKFNANCKEEEKDGRTGPGSCSDQDISSNDVKQIEELRYKLFNEDESLLKLHPNTKIDNKLIDQCKNILNSFDKRQYGTVIEYQGPTSYDIVSYLNDSPEGQEAFPGLYINGVGSFKYPEMINYLDNAINKFTLPENIETFRSFDPRKLNLNINDEIFSKSYTSVGLDKDVALLYNAQYTRKIKSSDRQYGVMKLNVSKGTNALYIPSGNRLAHSELVLPRNLSIKITKINKINNITYVEAETINRTE